MCPFLLDHYTLTYSINIALLSLTVKIDAIKITKKDYHKVQHLLIGNAAYLTVFSAFFCFVVVVIQLIYDLGIHIF